MAPFRPTNLNKRSYPGNANVIGPNVATTLGLSTTTCCSSLPSCGACTGPNNVLGCRCTFCYIPCCTVCCSCPCTVCTPSVPSGMWSSFEQYEASTRNAWGSGSTSSSGTATCLCSVGLGATNLSAACVDCKGFFICCGPSTNKWFVAPSCTEVSRVWNARGDAVTQANNNMGSCGWFVPDFSTANNPGGCCRTYWDAYYQAQYAMYWTDTSFHGNNHGGRAGTLNMNTGNVYPRGDPFRNYKADLNCVRAFRCTAS